MKITIIGAGNMGGAIARALAVSDISDLEITCTVRSADKLERLSAAGFIATTDNHVAVADADLVIFAV